jgi:hypothetical protein
MRTTLTLEPDVAARLEHLKEGRKSFKELVNTALRYGLDALEKDQKVPDEPFRTLTWDMGVPKIDLDDVAEALAYGEGEGYK